MTDLLITAAEVLETGLPVERIRSGRDDRPGPNRNGATGIPAPGIRQTVRQTGRRTVRGFLPDVYKARAGLLRTLPDGRRTVRRDRAAGVRQNKSAYTEAVPDSRLHRLRRQARNDADTLLDKAIDYVENNPAMFPEYDPKENIRRRVLIKGGFIL